MSAFFLLFHRWWMLSTSFQACKGHEFQTYHFYIIILVFLSFPKIKLFCWLTLLIFRKNPWTVYDSLLDLISPDCKAGFQWRQVLSLLLGCVLFVFSPLCGCHGTLLLITFQIAIGFSKPWFSWAWRLHVGERASSSPAERLPRERPSFPWGWTAEARTEENLCSLIPFERWRMSVLLFFGKITTPVSVSP